MVNHYSNKCFILGQPTSSAPFFVCRKTVLLFFILELKELEELSPTSWLGVKVKCLVAINQFSNWIFHFSLFIFHFRETGVKVKCLVAIRQLSNWIFHFSFFFFHFRQKTHWFTTKKRPTFASKVGHLRPVNNRLMI